MPVSLECTPRKLKVVVHNNNLQHYCSAYEAEIQNVVRGYDH